ncbi:hypothetical protein GA0070213_10531 [Micromonospora humi]|uniref:Uncharacterized protein n=1 Tax=Micromonospora humi TaxID=745366 RepID=A0A1C5I7M8_9ACTN|nr:hypothetical protein GA0070213_10531 [Micromonospora humi]
MPPSPFNERIRDADACFPPSVPGAVAAERPVAGVTGGMITPSPTITQANPGPKIPSR